MTIEQNSELLQAALSYAARGWRIFPLKPFTKIPMLPGAWPEYASYDYVQVREWWSQTPQANIAIVAGEQLAIIDVDRKPGKPDGWVTVGALVDQSTPWVATPNGGYHFYYRPAPGAIHSASGVDAQVGNHYCLAPPSRVSRPGTREVGQYVWGSALGPVFEDGIRPFPTQLFNYLHRIGENVTKAPDMPDLLGSCPEVPLHRFKGGQQAFLARGVLDGFPSRSEVIHSLTRRLYELGWKDAEVLTGLWNNEWVQWTCMDKRHENYNRGLEYLWMSCKKMRQHRRLTMEEAFGAPETGAAARELIHKAQRLSPGEDIRGLLQEAAGTDLDPLYEEELLSILKELGYSKQIVKKSLNEFRLSLRNQAKVLNWRHTAGEEKRPLPTVENLEVLLAHKNVSVRYNLMEHKIEIRNLCEKYSKEEKLNSQLTNIRSWAAQFRMPIDTVREQLISIAAKNEYHPFKELVDRITWDGTPRIQRVLDTLQVDSHRRRTRDILVYRWLVSIVAAVYGYGTRAPRGVLTLVGRQHIGKSTWLKYLMPEDMYHQGHVLRADQRDSVVKGLRYLLVEIGELGTTFRRQDIESLKNHIGQHEDVHRLPYAHAESTWKRRTIFAASANNTDLLKDQTGNTRWWVVPITGIDLDSMETWWGDGRGQELLQFWKEVHLLYEQGEKWDLTDQELFMLEEHNDEFRDVPPIEGALLDTYKWEEEPPEKGYPVPKTLSEICQDIGVRAVLPPHELYQLREALRRHTGMSNSILKRINLATMDGREVDAEWRRAQAEKQKDKKTLRGRYWYVPALKGFEGGAFQ